MHQVARDYGFQYNDVYKWLQGRGFVPSRRGNASSVASKRSSLGDDDDDDDDGKNGGDGSGMWDVCELPSNAPPRRDRPRGAHHA